MPTVEPPEAPTGWSEPTPYPESFLIRAKWLIGLFLLSAAIFLPNIRDAFIRNPLSVLTLVGSNIIQLSVIAIVVLLALVLPHEFSHKFASRLLGYRSTVELRQMLRGKEPFNHIEGQWVDASDYNRILLAPLFFITVLAGGLVLMDISELTNVFGLSVLVLNTSTSGDDIRKLILGIREKREMKIRHQLEDGNLVVYRTFKIED